MDKDQAPLVIRNLEQREGFSIMSFEDYSQLKSESRSKSKAKNSALASQDGANNIKPRNSIETDPQTKRPKTE